MIKRGSGLKFCRHGFSILQMDETSKRNSLTNLKIDIEQLNFKKFEYTLFAPL